MFKSYKTCESERQAIIVIRYLLSVQLIGLIETLVNVKRRANMDRIWDIDSHMRQTAVDWIFNPCDLQITISQKQQECIINK